MRGARNNRNQWAEGKAAIEWFHGIGRLDGDGNKGSVRNGESTLDALL
jgi:hypothetical protein